MHVHVCTLFLLSENDSTDRTGTYIRTNGGSKVVSYPFAVLTGNGGSSRGGHSYTSNTYGCDWGHNAVIGSLRFILAVTGSLYSTVSCPQICYAIRGRDDTFYAAVAGSLAVLTICLML